MGTNQRAVHDPETEAYAKKCSELLDDLYKGLITPEDFFRALKAAKTTGALQSQFTLLAPPKKELETH